MLGNKTNAILQAGALGTLVNNSSYGATIPLVWGTAQQSLLAIWAGNLREGPSGKKIKPFVRVPSYLENIDFLLGHNPIQGVLATWINTSYYDMLRRKYTTTITSGTVTVPDPTLFQVLAVTITATYSQTFNDYGGQGSRTLSGTYEIPCWNAAFNGPDPCDTAAYHYLPYVYTWVFSGSGSPVITFPYYAAVGSIGGATVNVYYISIGTEPDAAPSSSVAKLFFEPQLGQFGSGQPITYPYFAGLGSVELDLGASGALPQLRVETRGSFNFYPDPTLVTSGGDCDFSVAATDILNSGPAQGGLTGALGLTAVQHGVNLNDYPGVVQRKMWTSTVGILGVPNNIPFDNAVTKDSFLVVFYKNDTASGPPTGISDTLANDWTPILAVEPIANNFCYGWVCQANATGADAVTIESAGAFHQQMEMFEVSGFDTLDSFQAGSGASGTPTIEIASTTRRATPGLLLAWWQFSQSGYPLVASPHWSLVTGISINGNGPEYGILSEQRTVWGPKTITDTHPDTSSAWAGCILAFKNTNIPQYPVGLGNIIEPTSMANATLGARAGGLWGSLPLTAARAAKDILTDLYASGNMAPVYSGFKLKSIAMSEVSTVANGAVFTAPTASGPVASLGPADFIGDSRTPPGSVDGKAQLDAPPILSMQHFYRGNQYNPCLTTQPNPAGVSIFGARKADPMRRDEIQDPQVARTLLQIASNRQVYLRNTLKYKLKMNRLLLEPMDLVDITDPQLGLTNFPARVTSIDEDSEHNLDCQFEPFIYGVNAPGVSSVTAVSPFNPDFTTVPTPVNPPIIFEGVPQLNESANFEDLWLIVSDSDPAYGGCIVYISTDGGNSYGPVPNGTIIGNGITGYVGGDWPLHVDPDQTNDLSIDLTESRGAINEFTTGQRDAFDSVCFVSGNEAGGGPIEILASGSAYFGPDPPGSLPMVSVSGSFLIGDLVVAFFRVRAPGGAHAFASGTLTADAMSAGVSFYNSLTIDNNPAWTGLGIPFLKATFGDGVFSGDSITTTPNLAPGSFMLEAFDIEISIIVLRNASPSTASASSGTGNVINDIGSYTFNQPLTGTNVQGWSNALLVSAPKVPGPPSLVLSFSTPGLTGTWGALPAGWTGLIATGFSELAYFYGAAGQGPYELISYNAEDLTAAYKYSVLATGPTNAIRRGVYATAPLDHPDGSRFAFIGNVIQNFPPGALRIPLNPAWIGVTLYFKFQAYNTFSTALQNVADLTPYTFTPTGNGQVNPLGLPPQLFLVNGT